MQRASNLLQKSAALLRELRDGSDDERVSTDLCRSVRE